MTHKCFYEIIFFDEREGGNDERQIRGEKEISGIGDHQVKFTKNQKKLTKKFSLLFAIQEMNIKLTLISHPTAGRISKTKRMEMYLEIWRKVSRVVKMTINSIDQDLLRVGLYLEDFV